METERDQRRLTTILASDVVGYSRLMAADESGTLARLRAHRRELISPKTREHNGRMVKLVGDGALLVFGSVVDAVCFAVDVQTAMADHNAGVPEERRITFRIGINIGDIIVEDDDIYGDGVNIAARLEALAEPGGICISRNVFNQVKNKLDVPFEDMGEQSLKNIPEPVQVYRVLIGAAIRSGALGTVAGAAAGPALPAKPSIAVLPFNNMSIDPDQEFFADGLTEDIITELSRFSTLFVTARNSSFAFKGKSVDVKDVGRRLGVRYVVEGSVRRAGNRLRITAQLIDAQADTHLWAERYDRNLEDIFEVQDEVTRAIVTAIEPHLASTDRESARRKPPENLGAWECYQRGMWHVYQHTAEDSAKGQELFRRAIAIDPGFAAPHAAQAFSLYYEVVGGLNPEPGDRLERAYAAAQAAVAADEWDAFGHEVLGRVLMLRGEHQASIAAHQTSLRLNPNYANAHYGLGFALCFCGRAEEALREMDEAERLSPHDPLLWAFIVIRSFALTILRRYDEAVTWARRAQQWPSATVWTNFCEVVPLAHLGRLDEARAALERAYRVKPELSVEFFRQILNFRDPAEMTHFMEGLHQAGLPR